jgi:hypothetical protein
MTLAVKAKPAIAEAVHSTPPTSPQLFIQNSELQQNDLPQALKILQRTHLSTHTPLSDASKQMIAASLNEEGLPPDARGATLIKFLKEKTELFPEVDAALLSQNAAAQAIEAVPCMQKPARNDEASKILLKVKALGMQAGLTEADVNNALEEIVLEEGSRLWMVKVGHLPKYRAWQQSLARLATDEEIIYFQEGLKGKLENQDWYVASIGAKKRGHLRGLESEHSKLSLALGNSYFTFFRMSIKKTPDYAQLEEAACALFVYSYTNRPVRESVENLRSQSRAAELILQILRDTPAKTSTSKMAELAIKEMPDATEWVMLLEALLLSYYKDKEIFPAVEDMITCGKVLRCNVALDGKLNEKMLQDRRDAQGRFLEQAKGPRDIEYAQIFCEERSDLPKDKIAFVSFGSAHAPGFKCALLATQKERDDSEASAMLKTSRLPEKSGSTSPEHKQKD